MAAGRASLISHQLYITPDQANSGAHTALQTGPKDAKRHVLFVSGSLSAFSSQPWVQAKLSYQTQESFRESCTLKLT